jgi:hypothetical protein
MWDGTFTREDCNKINQRVLGSKVHLPKVDVDADISYACWKNSERVSIHASTFQKHIAGFPLVDSDENPPEHTVVIEADIRHAPKRKPKQKKNKDDEGPLPAKVTPELRNKIYARCGDSDMKDQHKQVDPALKLYVGCHCMIIDNDDISKGRANGTLCRVVGVKRKTDQPLRWKNYDGKKVYTTNVSDVEYVEFEHFPKKIEQKSLESEITLLQEEIKQDPSNSEKMKKLESLQNQLKKMIASRRFKLTAKKYYCTFYKSDIDPPEERQKRKNESRRNEKKQKLVMMQIPVNLNDATTAHKLQGVTKKYLIVHNWTYTHGWVYTVLSRVRTRDGLFLNKPLVYKEDSFKLPPSLARFQWRMSKKIPDNAKN